MKTTSPSLQRRARMGAHIATAASLLLIASLGFVSAKGKPPRDDGDGDGGGGSSTSPVEYQLTWLPGFGGSYSFLDDINSLGIAVGSANDADGNAMSFIVTGSSGMTTTTDFFSAGGWQLPDGWAFSSRSPRINEGNMFCGLIFREAPFHYALVLIDLDAAPGVIEPVWVFEEDFRSFHIADQNEHNDVLIQFFDDANQNELYQPYLYEHTTEHTTGQLVALKGTENTYAVALNDNLDVALQEADYDSPVGYGNFAYRYSVQWETLEDLSSELPRNSRSGGHDITNDGTVAGHFDVKRRRTAGSVDGTSSAWISIDGDIPDDATAAAASESGQVLGGFNTGDDGLISDRNSFGTDLWIHDPNDGLFSVNDLVVGDAADVTDFISFESYCRAVISEPYATTGYGIIAGTFRFEFGTTWYSFILTPKTLSNP